MALTKLKVEFYRFFKTSFQITFNNINLVKKNKKIIF